LFQRVLGVIVVFEPVELHRFDRMSLLLTIITWPYWLLIGMWCVLSVCTYAKQEILANAHETREIP